MSPEKKKIDWPSLITVSILICATCSAVGGFLFNQRVLPKEKEYETRFDRDEKETKEKFDQIEEDVKEIKVDMEKRLDRVEGSLIDKITSQRKSLEKVESSTNLKIILIDKEQNNIQQKFVKFVSDLKRDQQAQYRDQQEQYRRQNEINQTMLIQITKIMQKLEIE